MKWVGITEFCKGLINTLNHFIASYGRKRADFFGLSNEDAGSNFLKHVWARMSILGVLAEIKSDCLIKDPQVKPIYI